MRRILALALVALAWSCAPAAPTQTPAQQLQACTAPNPNPQAVIDACAPLLWDADVQTQTSARAAAETAVTALNEAVQNANTSLATVPAMFVDRGACPGEGCHYAMWTARDAPVQLRERPDASSRVIATIPVNEQVLGFTGEVHVTPVRGSVVRAVGPFHVGDIVYRMGYIGEGTWSYWHNGRILRGDLGVGGDNELDPTCEMGDASCQPVFAFPGGSGEGEGDPNPWWGQVRRSNGQTGWVTDIYTHFSGVDLFE